MRFTLHLIMAGTRMCAENPMKFGSPEAYAIHLTVTVVVAAVLAVVVLAVDWWW